MFRSSWFYLLLLGAMLLVLGLVVRSGLVASKHMDEPINSAMRAALARERPELSTEEELLIDRLYPVRAPGTGQRLPRIMDEVAVRYTGRFLDGRVFDSSDRHGGMLTFRVGMGDVIKGWDEALLGMKKGEKRTLIVPYWLAYGDAGNPPMIPPKATLVFDVEMVDFR
jgi:FKBP-type peptidyl-prolyl cis-trans isomerase